MPFKEARDRVILTHPKGASVTILFFGATIISWKSPDRPVRGGIPIVFPNFGPAEHPDHKDLPQHGFSRNAPWEFDDSLLMDNEAGVAARFTLEPLDKIRAVYKRPFQLVYIVTLAEHQLTTDLHVKNTGPDPFEFQALLHTYIRAPSKEVSISPLKGKSYIDKTEVSAEGRATVKEEKRDVVDVKKPTDSVYENAPPSVQVKWPGGGVEVRSAGFPTLTIWNPQEQGAEVPDMEEGGWERFVCVEPGYARGFKKLDAGSTYAAQQVLSVL
ncbi:hypothetical protein EWM64_g5087 [Hericium alpestre]|uniref:Glucose-6-phosphate 1-epimerase n=1 Tax=Hericium alpestre TaxID=135208 RepID=A0A4Y9ZXX9_9AGAM|nr:hypothetical protein EWM64_g5087 [Hericium alpestre]